MRISWSIVFWLTIIGIGLEFYLSTQVALLLGWWTFLWLIGAAGFGYFLIMEEKIEFIFRIAEAMYERKTLWSAVADSGRTVVAALLFIIPGVVSDILALIVWFFPLDFIFKEKSASSSSHTQSETPLETEKRHTHTSPRPVIIEGEFKREDEKR